MDDSSALYLDSTYFGNVARFLNHRYKAESILCYFFSPFTSLLGLTLVPEHYRCRDLNLVDAPVSIKVRTAAAIMWPLLQIASLKLEKS